MVNDKPGIHRQFDSIAAFGAASSDRKISDNCPNSVGSDWTQFKTYHDGLTMCKTGDTSLVGEAEKLMNKLDESIEVDRPSWVPSPFGAYPIVPEAIAGMPDPMRRRHPLPEDTAPVRIVVDLFASCGFPANVLMKRGVSVLALTMKLQEVRPVQLQVIVGSNDYQRGPMAVIVDVCSSPLELATACYALTAPVFFRALGFATLIDMGCGRCIPADMHRAVKRSLKLDANAIYIDPCIGSASELQRHPMIADPVAWINEQLRRFNNAQDDDEAPLVADPDARDDEQRELLERLRNRQHDNTPDPIVQRPTTDNDFHPTVTDAPRKPGRVMQSRFPGKCATCGKTFAKGATIRYDTTERKAHHTTC